MNAVKHKYCSALNWNGNIKLRWNIIDGCNSINLNASEEFPIPCPRNGHSTDLKSLKCFA